MNASNAKNGKKAPEKDGHIAQTFVTSASANAMSLYVLATLDTLRLVMTQDQGAVALAYMFTGFGLALYPALIGACVVSLLATGWHAIHERFARQFPRATHWVATFALGVTLGGVALLVLKPWELSDDPYHLQLVLPLSGMLCAAVLLHARARAPRLMNSFSLLVGVALYIVDWQVLPGQYVSFHRLAFVCAVGFIAFALWRAASQRRTVIVVCLIALLSQVSFVRESHVVRDLYERQGVVQNKLLSFTHAAFDLDKDGHSALYGGGDCDDFDASRHPGQCESQDSTVDANCNGHNPQTNAIATKSARAARTDLPDIYFVLIDALRADGGVTGETLEDLPGFSALRSEAWSFDAAYTPIPGTYYAMASMNESRHWRDTDDDGTKMMSLLRTHGYDVQLWIHTERLGVNGERFLSSKRSIGDPFRVPKADKLSWTKNILDAALAEALPARDPLQEQTALAPRFRWLHLLDVHSPRLRGKTTASQREKYQAEVAYVDAEVSRFYRALRTTERGKDAVVVIAADHGEGLGEHGQSFHGSELYDEEVRVPLYFFFPDEPAKRFRAAASLLDILPTVAGYIGFEPDERWQGHDWTTGEPKLARVLSMILPVDNWAGRGRSSAEMLLDGSHKLIYNIDSNVYELYDLKSDPEESRNLIADNTERFDSMRAALRSWQDRDSCVRPLR